MRLLLGQKRMANGYATALSIRYSQFAIRYSLLPRYDDPLLMSVKRRD
jgi:hypothetical protein